MRSIGLDWARIGIKGTRLECSIEEITACLEDRRVEQRFLRTEVVADRGEVGA